MHFSLLGQIKVDENDYQNPYTTCNMLIYFNIYISHTSSCATFPFSEGPHLHPHSCDLLGRLFHREYLLKQPPLLPVLLFEVMLLPTGAVEEHFVSQLLMSGVPCVRFPHSCNGKSLSGMGLTRERWCCAGGWLSRLGILASPLPCETHPAQRPSITRVGEPDARDPAHYTSEGGRG